MDSLRAVLRALALFVVVLLCPPAARAAIPASGSAPQYSYTIGPGGGISASACPGGTSGWNTSNVAVANWWISYKATCNPDYTNTLYSCSGNLCQMHYQQQGGGSGDFPLPLDQQGGYTCPANSTLSGSSCTCNSGYAEDATHTSCVVPSAAQQYCAGIAGPYYGTRSVPAPGTTAAGSSATFCVGSLGPASDGSLVSCEGTGTIDTVGSYPGGSVVGWVSKGSYTGNTCASTTPVSAPTPAPSAAGTPCNDPTSCPPPKGQCPGSVNGVAVWVPCSSTSTSKTGTSTTTAPDGTQTKVDTTNQTSCNGATCTTTTTTTTTNVTNNTSSSSTTVTTSSKGDYCTANPKDAACAGQGGSESTFGGSCSAGFTCSGDAALCAASRATWLTHCDLSAPSDASTSALNSAAAGSVVPETSSAISTASFDSSDAIGAGVSCIGDRTITVMGQTVTIAMSTVCPALSYLGTLNLAVSWLLAMIIVFRRTS